MEEQLPSFLTEEGEEHLAKTLSNESNYVGKKLSTNSDVPGRIGKEEFYGFWKDDLKSSEFVLDTIKSGYKIPFTSIPPSSYSKNNSSCLKNKEFAYCELIRLEKLGVISKVNSKPYIVLPLSVVFSKKLRLVVDASRHLNPWVEDRHVKLENLDVAELTLQEGDWQTKQDLDSGYWHVPLNIHHRQYVGVHFEHDNGIIDFWVWNTLFLGLKDAVYIFTKLLMPHRQYLRAMGIRNNWYIDDQRILGRNEVECKANTQIAIIALEKAGWILNVEKSCDPPTQALVFLGLINDSVKMKFFVPEIKSQKLVFEINTLVNSKGKVPVRHIASVVGKIQACSKAIGPCVRLLTRSSYKVIAAARSWSHHIKMSDMAKTELAFLSYHFESLNGFPMRASKTLVPLNIKICSDASELGNFVYKISDSNMTLHKRMFTPEEQRLSSTHRELLAFHDFYCSEKALKFKGENIIHYTDSYNVSTILSVGARNVSLQAMVLDIFLAWKEKDLKVIVEYIPRSDIRIVFADKGSREFDLQDFSLDFDSFCVLNQAFGPFDVDCFASKGNKKCVQYFSKYYEEEAMGTNFFAQILSCQDNLFIFPPPFLTVSTILHLCNHQAKGVLIVPLWMSAHFWNFISDDGKHLNVFVKDFAIMNPQFVCNSSVRSSTFRGFQKFKTLALSVDFKNLNKVSMLCPNVQKNFCLEGGCYKCWEN